MKVGGEQGTRARPGLRAAVNARLEEISFRTGLIAGTTGLVVLAAVASAGVLAVMLGHGGPVGRSSTALTGASSRPAATSPAPVTTPPATTPPVSTPPVTTLPGRPAPTQPTSPPPTKPVTVAATSPGTAAGQPSAPSARVSGSAPTAQPSDWAGDPASSGPGFQQGGSGGATWWFGFGHQHRGHGSWGAGR